MIFNVYDVIVIVHADTGSHGARREPVGYTKSELHQIAQNAANVIEAERCSMDGISGFITDISLDFGKVGNNTSYASFGVIYLLIPDKIKAPQAS